MDNIECYLSHWTSSFFYYCSLPSGISMDPAIYFCLFVCFQALFFWSKIMRYLLLLLRILIHEISLYKNPIPECLAEEITQSSCKQEGLRIS